MVLVFIIGLLIAFSVGFIYGGYLERQVAIKAGIGRWETNPATGTTSFIYGNRPGHSIPEAIKL